MRRWDFFPPRTNLMGLKTDIRAITLWSPESEKGSAFSEHQFISIESFTMRSSFRSFCSRRGTNQDVTEDPSCLFPGLWLSDVTAMNSTILGVALSDSPSPLQGPDGRHHQRAQDCPQRDRQLAPVPWEDLVHLETVQHTTNHSPRPVLHATYGLLYLRTSHSTKQGYTLSEETVYFVQLTG